MKEGLFLGGYNYDEKMDDSAEKRELNYFTDEKEFFLINFVIVGSTRVFYIQEVRIKWK